MNNFVDTKRIDVEFVDASKGRQYTSWSIPLAPSDTARNARQTAGRLFGVTLVRRVGGEWRQTPCLDPVANEKRRDRRCS
jgi:hypothetical protein